MHTLNMDPVGCTLYVALTIYNNSNLIYIIFIFNYDISQMNASINLKHYIFAMTAEDKESLWYIFGRT